MGKAPCCDKDNVKRGPWSPEEDETLKTYIHQHGTGGNWIAFPKKAGLRRCGKSCRLRWLNYLRPDIRHGGFSEEEDIIIYALYNQMGSRWSVIASQLHGRTDNDVKNHWNTKLKKKLSTTKTSTNVMMVNEDNSNENPTFFGLPNSYPNLGFSSLLNEDLGASTTTLTNFDYGHAQNYSNTPTNYSGLVLTDSQQFNTTNETKNQSVSPSQEDSSTISSSFSMGNLDEQNVAWPNNNNNNNINGGDYGSFMMNFGLGFSNEYVNGYWSSLENGTREESVTNLVSNLGDCELYGDIKPQGLLQSVIYQ